MTDHELRELLKDMSVSEKVDQLLQVNGSFYEQEGFLTGPQDNGTFSRTELEQAGSMLGSIGAAGLIDFQKQYLKTQPHHIPLLFMADIINGYQTVFPIPLAQGATFRPELAGRCAQVAAREAAASGLHVTFSPMADLVRDARWGRVMESTGEDHYLNSCFAAAVVEGYQGDDVAGEGRICACVKHFAGYGAPMGGREYNHVELSERSLREDYLPAYEAAVRAGAKLVMTSFNTLERIPCTGNKKLLRDLLRGEMGFEGVLISDWAAINELVSHGVAADKPAAAKAAIEAGVDIDMMTDVYVKYLPQLIESGQIDPAVVDEAVMRVLKLKNDLGLFDNPYKDADPAAEERLFLCEEHRIIAREAAAESFVLLKNDGVLPLSRKEKTAFIGPYVEEKELTGSWTIFARPDHCVTIKEGVCRKTGQADDSFIYGFPLLDPDTRFAGFRGIVDSQAMPQVSGQEEQALQMAAGSKTVVLTLGEHRQHSGEAASRTDLSLPEVQLDFLKKVHQVNPNLVAVIFTGRPLDLRVVRQYAKAILIVWFPGTEGGNAIADVLYGDRQPSGKLPMSFPYCTGQVPVYYNEFATGRRYDKEPDVRFASKYLDAPNEPLYPFGYGLTYTDFTYTVPVLTAEYLTGEAGLTAAVTVKNTGCCEGVETVQLYIQDVTGSVCRPVRELKAFRKVPLKAGESKTVSFAITEEMLRFYGADMQYRSERGDFMLYIGGDSTTKNGVPFRLS